MIKQGFLIIAILVFAISCTTWKSNSTKASSPHIVTKSFVKTVEQVMNEKGMDEGIQWFKKNKDSSSHKKVESEIRQLGYFFLEQLDNPELALEAFKLNIMTFPNSGRAHDNLGDAYVQTGDYEASMIQYKKASELSSKRHYHHLPFLNPSKYVQTILPEDVSELYVAKGDWDNEIAFVYLQGGPDFELHINERDALHLMNDSEKLLKIYPYQAPMLNNAILNASPSLTAEEASSAMKTDVEILERVVEELKNRNKKVFIIGHSHGAAICAHYMTSENILADKIVLMGFELDNEDELHLRETTKPGEFIRWEEGIKPVNKKFFRWLPEDYPLVDEYDRILENADQLVYNTLTKPFTKLISIGNFEKTILIYADKDEATGKVSEKEKKFLSNNNVPFYVLPGDHHCMLNQEFMSKLKNHLLSNEPLLMKE